MQVYLAKNIKDHQLCWPCAWAVGILKGKPNAPNASHDITVPIPFGDHDTVRTVGKSEGVWDHDTPGSSAAVNICTPASKARQLHRSAK